MSDYGLLVKPPLDLQRRNFKEMCRLLGVKVKYRYPLANKQYTLQGELDTDYSLPITVDCVFNEQITQKTSKRLGWNAEAMTDSAIINLPYDLEGLQVGCLVDVPSAFDNTPPRTFRIVEMSAIQIYPSSIACRIVPEYESTMERSEIEHFENSNFNLLNEENSRINYLLNKEDSYVERRRTETTSEGAVINPDGFIHDGFGKELLADENNGRQV